MLRGHKVIALKLGHLDLPTSCSGSRTSVDVKIDLVTGVVGRDPHVLPGVVATDDGRHCAPRVGHSHGVSVTVSEFPTQFYMICRVIWRRLCISYRTSY